MKEFTIGYTFFSAATNHYLLGFDAIQLYNADDNHDNDENPYNKLPWDISTVRDENNIPTLWQVFSELYSLSYLGTIQEAEDGLTNYDIYNLFKQEFYSLEEAMTNGWMDGMNQGREEVLEQLKASLDSGISVNGTLRRLFLDDIIVVSGGKYHFVPINRDLKLNNYVQENLVQLENGQMQYM